MRNAVPSQILISGFQLTKFLSIAREDLLKYAVCRLTNHYPTLYTGSFIQLGLGLTCSTDDDLLKGGSNHELTQNLRIDFESVCLKFQR